MRCFLFRDCYGGIFSYVVKILFMNHTKKEEPSSLLIETISLLRNDSRSVFEISRDTGIPFYWLRHLRRGKHCGASVTRVQKLYEALSGRKLKV